MLPLPGRASRRAEPGSGGSSPRPKKEVSRPGARRGPLPTRDYLQLEDWHRKRYLVLPGMTGLW